jgi:hypothetical protein
VATKVSKSSGWRRAISLIAAYAFVIQSILAISVVTQAGASDGASYSGTFFVICSGNDGSAASGEAGAPIKPNTHCQICVLSISAGGIDAQPAVLPAWQAGVVEHTALAGASTFISFHRVRAGLTRAPPRIA